MMSRFQICLQSLLCAATDWRHEDTKERYRAVPNSGNQSVEKLVRKDPANDLKELLAWAEQAGKVVAVDPEDAAESLAKRRRREVGFPSLPPPFLLADKGEDVLAKDPNLCLAVRQHTLRGGRYIRGGGPNQTIKHNFGLSMKPISN